MAQAQAALLLVLIPFTLLLIAFPQIVLWLPQTMGYVTG